MLLSVFRVLTNDFLYYNDQFTAFTIRQTTTHKKPIIILAQVKPKIKARTDFSERFRSIFQQSTALDYIMICVTTLFHTKCVKLAHNQQKIAFIEVMKKHTRNISQDFIIPRYYFMNLYQE